MVRLTIVYSRVATQLREFGLHREWWFCCQSHPPSRPRLCAVIKIRRMLARVRSLNVCQFYSDSRCLTVCSRHWCKLFQNDAWTSYKPLRAVRLGQKRPGHQGHHAVSKRTSRCYKLYDWPRDFHQVEATSRKRTGAKVLHKRVSLSSPAPGGTSTEVYGRTHLTFHKMQERFFRTWMPRNTLLKMFPTTYIIFCIIP